MQRRHCPAVVSTMLALACGATNHASSQADAGPEVVTDPGPALTVPPGFTDERLAAGLVDPTAMAFAPDARLFVAEQGGHLRVVKAGALLATPFLSVSVDAAGERGLLGVAIDPAFATNGWVYVYYTATSPVVHSRISRFTAAGDVAAPGSEVVLVELDPLSAATNHNGGAIHFGPDGKLYAGVGDNANGANAQSLATRLGKILRYDADGSIPTDNPFFATASGANRAIWAMGLRNPFTFAFQPGSGRMAVNDVGQSTWEEIDEGVAGGNYGWPITEGPTSDPRFRGPIYAYGHGTGPATGCAISGAAFYGLAPRTLPAAYVGSYFFADLCSGWIRRLEPNGAVSDFVSGLDSPVDLQLGPDDALYYLARGGGVVGRIRYVAAAGP